MSRRKWVIAAIALTATAAALLAAAVVGVRAYLSADREYAAWGFTLDNATYDRFSKASIDYNGRSFGCGTGSMSATLPGDMPRSADIVLEAKDGTTHRVHVVIPRPPVPDPANPFYSGIPRVYFTIKGDDRVEVGFTDPRFAP